MSTSSAFTPLDIVGDVPRARQPFHWRLLQLLSAYLPLLLMLLLALGTWWLANNSLPGSDDAPAAPPRHEPDYEMRQFAVQRFAPGGELHAQIEGQALRHYPDTDTVEIDHVRLRAIDPQGRATLATAGQALADGAGTEVRLLGQADVLREGRANEEPVHFRSEFLHLLLESERVLTDKPVTVERGGTVIHAESMEYSHADQVVRFAGRTRATIRPKVRP